MTTPGRRRVVVLGDVATDVVARLAEPLARGSDASAAVRMTGGGSGANVAWWLARAGVAVTLVARVGGDDAGRVQLEALRQAGVGLAVTVDPERPTGVVVVLVEPGGERTMLPDRGANLALEPADLPPSEVAAAKHLHVSGYALLHAGPRAAALAALEQARAAGLTTSVDASSVRPLETVGPEAFLRWTSGVELLRSNLLEARLLSGAGDPEQAARALGARYGSAAVTLGADGALWSDGTQVWHSAAAPDPGCVGLDRETRSKPTHPGSATVDTTGAGDAFTAGLLAAWIDGADPQACLARGNTLAAESITHPGARPDPRPSSARSDFQG